MKLSERSESEASNNDFDMFDLNLTDGEVEKCPKMTSDEFVTKTKKVLNDIMNAFGQSWYHRKITDAESELAPCNECKGEGCFKLGDKEINCVQDYEGGECYEKCFDDSNFYTEMTDVIMFGKDSPFMDLMQAEIINPH